LKNRVQLLVFERLVEAFFAVDVEQVPEAHQADDDEDPFNPPAYARRPGTVDEGPIRVRQVETSPIPCTHYEP